ncbi:MAG TPA: hypothetical protein VG797_11210 [Phycisphaerales bacterium]|nr:hypothetical protein [Phycisphaerales bacterium]
MKCHHVSRLALAGVLVALGSASCSTKNLRVSSFTAPATEGVVYCLPKTLLKISVTYTVVKRTEIVGGVTRSPTLTIEVRKPIAIQAVTVADRNNCFAIDDNEVADSVWLQGSTKVTVGNNLLLTGVESNLTDKGPEVVESAVSSALAIAKMVVAAGAVSGEPLTAINARLAQIATEIAQKVAALQGANAAAPPALLTDIDNLMKEREKLLAVVKAYQDSNSESVELVEIPYSVTVDPSDATTFVSSAQPYSSYTLQPPSELFGVGNIAPTPVVVNVYRTAVQIQDAATPYAAGPHTPGVLYRPAMPVRVSVFVGTAVAFDDVIPMNQFSTVALLDAKYKPWAMMKTAVKFDATNGGLIEYGVDFSSSAERAAKVLETSTSKLGTTIGDLQKIRGDAAKAAEGEPLANAKAQKELLQAEYDVLKLQQEIAKYKKEHGLE